MTASSHTGLELYAVLALVLPLLSGVISLIIPPRYSWIISITAPLLLLLSVISSSLLLVDAWGEPTYTAQLNWIPLLSVSAGIYINQLSVVMMWVVTLVSFAVHLYSTGYMAGDAAFRKYFGMLGFFTFSMLGIVLADNLFLLFVCWELVGFSSYMLIGHWTEKPEAGQAAKKAFIMNRVGDLGFIIALMVIFTSTGTFQLTTLEQAGQFELQTVACICLFLGVTGKSAQFPLLTWLADAMEGPTPVSALIHAATMVAAGVFLLARVFFILTPTALDVIAITGTITALLGAGAALFHFDIKKILAYSTISQLGLMVLAIGASAPYSATLHLLAHAFFKAGLFLGAGAVIHALHQAQHGSHESWDVQDIRNLGGLQKSLPVTFIIFIICGAALSGIPFFSGFQSKETILAAVLSWSDGGPFWRWIITAGTFLVSFLTVVYVFRLLWYVFLAPASAKTTTLHITEVPGVMRIAMILMAAGSLWYSISWNPFSASGWYHVFEESLLLTVVSVVWVMLALLTAYFLFRKKSSLHTTPLGQSLSNTFYLDAVYRLAFVKPMTSLAIATTHIDKKWIDGLLHGIAYGHVILSHLVGWFDRIIVDGIVNGISATARTIGSFTRSFQRGKIQYYIFWASLGLILMLLFLL